jgi:hypothetical protein
MMSLRTTRPRYLVILGGRVALCRRLFPETQIDHPYWVWRDWVAETIVWIVYEMVVAGPEHEIA